MGSPDVSSGGGAQGGDYRLGYRGDVEGLRAVAILLVVACHAGVKWLAGGFVGVDVFFVLSGYLITGLLVQEVHTRGRLRFANFYARRLRRLMPALFLMLLVTGWVCWQLKPLISQLVQAWGAASAAMWVSNFYFGFMHLDYFGPAAQSILFLHTWSLGVEEQFYLVWPVLVVLAMGAWRGASRRPTLSRLKFAFAAVFVAAFALSMYWTWHAPRLAFYMMPARAWQFALGGLVFLAIGSPNFGTGARLPGRRWSVAAGWVGLALILGSAFWIDGSVPYPGYWSLLPTTGAAMALVGVNGHDRWYSANCWLATRPMQSLGRVSYSWYLWHWPVLLIGADFVGTVTGWYQLGLVVLSLLIAAASYRFVETPIRHLQRLVVKPRRTVLAGFVMIVLGGSAGLFWHHEIKQGMAASPTLAAFLDEPEIYRMGCTNGYGSAALHVCAFGDPHAAHTAVSVGDSISAQWVPAYRRLFDRPGWRLLVMTKAACPMVNAPIYDADLQAMYTSCAEWRARALHRIAELKPDVVLTSTAYVYDYTHQQWLEGTRSVLADLAGAAHQVFVLQSTPYLGFDGPNCLDPRSRLDAIAHRHRGCMVRFPTPRSRAVFDAQRMAAEPFRNVHMIDMTSAYCADQECHAELDGRIVYRDGHHLTASFARSLAPQLARALGVAPPAAPGPAGEMGAPD